VCHYKQYGISHYHNQFLAATNPSPKYIFLVQTTLLYFQHFRFASSHSCNLIALISIWCCCFASGFVDTFATMSSIGQLYFNLISPFMSFSQMK